MRGRRQAAFELSLEDRLNQAVADIGQIQQTLRGIAEPMKRLEALVAAAAVSSALIRDHMRNRIQDAIECPFLY